MYVVDLKQVKKDDILIVGGKGANLGEMIQAGINVPSGFCVTSKAYNCYIEENKMQCKIDELVQKIYENENKLDTYAKEIEKIIITGSLPQVIKSGIRDYYSNLGENIRVAVRSSATTEDLPEASFAGQQETFLNVYEIEDVFDKVKKCWASLWTARAIKYRKHMGFDKEKISIAIVVQVMIKGQISGVLFTVNPTSDNKEEMMINSTYGLGEAVVSGMVTPDTYICLKSSGEVVKKHKGSKEMSIVYDSFKGTSAVENTKEQREAFTLDENNIGKLIKAGTNIERHYGFPQDIEWTIENNKLYILQARAITTLEDKKHNKSKLCKEEINNLIEHCPVVPYPLDFQPLLIMDEEKAKVFSELGIKMENEIFMNDCGEFIIKSSKLRWSIKSLKILFIFRNFTNAENNYKKTEKFKNNILSKIESLQKKNHSDCSLEELGTLLRKAMEVIHEIGYVRFRYNIFPEIILGKIISRKLRKIDKNIMEYDLLSGLEYKTWTINEELKVLAEKAKENKEIYELISKHPLNKDEDSKILLDKLEPRYCEEIKKFLQRNGWKTSMSYIPFSTKSWNEDLNSFLLIIKMMMQSENKSKFDRNKFNYIKEKIISKLGQSKGEKLLKQVETYRYNHINREESLYMIETCYGLSRSMIREISKKILNILREEKEILYLTLDEVYDICKNPQVDIEKIRKTICIRKKARVKNMELWSISEVIDKDMEGKKLKGLSGSKGKVSGSVCIINNVNEFGKLNEGDVLVCKFTDPVWTPLFAIAKAVVSDSGGPLSHSAIVAREYGIPAVLGVGNATMLLKDGDEIIVDGDKGEVLY